MLFDIKELPSLYKADEQETNAASLVLIKSKGEKRHIKCLLHNNSLLCKTPKRCQEPASRPFLLQGRCKCICLKCRNSFQAHQNVQETREAFVNSIKRAGSYLADGTRGLEEN